MAAYGRQYQQYIRVICFTLVISTGHGQNSVQIQVTPVIRLGQDDLRITCSATGSYDAITSYTLAKNETNGLVNPVVQQLYSVATSSVSTIWSDTNLQSRANLSGVALPSSTATMVLTVLRDRVRCPNDAVGYRCEFSAIPTAGGALPQSVTDFQYVQITTPPSGVQPIIVQAELNCQQVPTSDINGRHVFAVGTVLTMSCTAEVGSTMETQHWCHKRSNDFAWDSPAFGVSHGEVTPGANCQYSRVSTYVHNVTSNDDSRTFTCEIGGNSQCGFGDFNSNITIYLSGTLPKTSMFSSVAGSNKLTLVSSVVPLSLIIVAAAVVIVALIHNQIKLKRKLLEERNQRTYEKFSSERSENAAYSDLKSHETSAYTNTDSSNSDRRMYDQLNTSDTEESVYTVPKF